MISLAASLRAGVPVRGCGPFTATIYRGGTLYDWRCNGFCYSQKARELDRGLFVTKSSEVG